MREESFRAVGFLMVAALVTAGLVGLLPRMLDAAGGSESEVATALKSTEPSGLEVVVKGFSVPLVSSQHSFTRVTFAPPQQGPGLSATLDFVGTLGNIQVSSVGVEELRFVSRTGGWQPVNGWAPRLAAAVAALEARRRALEAGDPAALRALLPPGDQVGGWADPQLQNFLRIRQRRYRVDRWLLRLERGEALVTEEGRVWGDLPERPVDDLSTRRLHLIEKDGEFFFSPTLM